MTLLSTDPFRRLLSLQHDLERTLDAPMLGLERARGVFPPINIFREADGLVIRAEVPGFTSDQIEITIEPQSLVIKGERPADEHTRPGSYHRRERQHGRFARSIALPRELSTEGATADVRNGVLTIRIPKSEAAKPRRISIAKAAQ